MIIDGHVHIGTWEHERFRRVSVSLSDAKREFLKYGITRACVTELTKRKLKNVYLGISGVREYWTLECGIRKLGAGRYIFGSDYPLAHPAMYLAAVDVLKITKREKELILAKNILRLIKGSNKIAGAGTK